MIRKIAMIDFVAGLVRSHKSGRPVFVGFNAAFDWAFVNFYFRQYPGRESLWYRRRSTSSRTIWDCVDAHGKTPESSRIPAEFKGSSLRHTHNALEDAMEQAELFRKMRERSAGNL